MNRLDGIVIRSLAAAAVCAVFATAVVAQDTGAESIEQFVGRKDSWNALVGATFRLEGRLGGRFGGRIRFEKCELDFYLKAGLPALPRDATSAEVQGSIINKDGKLAFEVTEIRKRETDVATLNTMRSKIDSGKADEWYRVANWAEKRGRFYDDPDLVSRVSGLREAGMMTEYRRLKPDDIAGLLDLSKRANQFGLGDSLGWRFTHEACRLELTKVRRDPKGDESVVLNRIVKDLPGADVPLTADDEPTRKSYQASPQAVYVEADPELRKKLHRALYVEVLLARIERDAHPDGKNGDEIADRIQKQLPELKPLADQYRQKTITFLTSRLDTLSRDDMLSLVARYTSQKRDDDARKVQLEWLKAQEPGRRQRGAQGLVDLADDYSKLLKDEKTATALYEEAYRLNPEMEEPVKWLTDHDLVLVDGRWIPEEIAPKTPEDRYAAAIREGRVVEGMTSAQVREALGARPASVVREASRAKVTELWVYPSQGLVVELVKPAASADAIVKQVTSIDRAD